MVGGSVTARTRGATAWVALAACAFVLVSCASQTRVSYSPKEQAEAVIPGIPGARLWGDDPTIGKGRPAGAARILQRQPTVLALSGGGADGAFGAGLLTGWSKRGTRPEFTFVTGASAGALIAPFAFLGPAHDTTLRTVFTSGELANLLQSDGIAGLLGTSVYKTGPLRNLIATYIDADILQAVAREYREGRRLFVVTTNLDAQRTAIWDMGRIAASGDPGALDLFRNVLTASASIPGVFSPTLIEVEAEGKRFLEMHVDGGVTTNLMVVPEAVMVSGTQLFPPNARPRVYIIMNGKLAPNFEVVKASTLPIVRRSIETAVRANTRHALLASYQFGKARNWELNLASVDPDFPSTDSIGFDPVYMGQLFEYAYQRGANGQLWQATPADYRIKDLRFVLR